MLRLLSELCGVVAASAGTLALIGLVLVISTVISVQPLSFELWRQTLYALTLCVGALLGLLIIGRIRFTERYPL